MFGTGKRTRWAGVLLGATVIAGCSEFRSGNLDYDLRGQSGTAAGIRQASVTRPVPDANGLITYPNYQVAVARSGDTVKTVAARVGIGAQELADFNGLTPDAPLNPNAVLALPRRVTGGSAGRPDITAIAGSAIDRASGAPGAAPVAVQGGQEPVRHRVARGETAFSIARLYGVSPASLAEWNGLGPDLTVREGQYLLIPLVVTGDGATGIPTPDPGLDAATPLPPSASSALPEVVEAEPLPESPQLDRFRTEASGASEPTPAPVPTPEPAAPSGLQRPVAGEILKPFSPSNEGIDFSAAEGAAVSAAAAGTVAAITRDTDQVPILVLRHADGLLTVYANIQDIRVEKGDTVSAGQRIASVGGGDPAFLHFEARRGFEAVDPAPLLR
ncbi:peptidoglycan DD-metalloendopeptidase family protein [uncultured Jannaschia sp.]|uniref:LysM peptidoglycan-binding domain-containing protein n=1 Tax=uncultured Jannaschia sp. TaxID=293347 RepID=UPI00262C50A1|nr:peptidoglycan DD-metalloendopeptidase family protein [uncultured Jannaschia sp.]